MPGRAAAIPDLMKRFFGATPKDQTAALNRRANKCQQRPRNQETLLSRLTTIPRYLFSSMKVPEVPAAQA